MISIVGIGANVYDTLIKLPCFPKEDTKLKAEEVSVSGGGPCGTGLVAAAKLGESCGYIGNLSNDSAGKFLVDDFKNYGVSTENINMFDGYSSFTSCIWLNVSNASRTCVFDRGNLPPLKLSPKDIEAIESAKVLMVDGNELSAAIEGAKTAQRAGVKVLYDAGGLYDGVENLLPYVDILIPSEEFALGFTGEKTADAAAKKLYDIFKPEVVVVTCGKRGGVLYDGDSLLEYPSFPVEAIDSNGAGDVFHGAFAFAVVKGFDYYDSCVFSSAVSALKCTGIGSRKSVPTYEAAIEFLKERGIDEFKENME